MSKNTKIRIREPTNYSDTTIQFDIKKLIFSKITTIKFYKNESNTKDNWSRNKSRF